MSFKQFRPWLIRYLYVAALVHILVGVLLPWISKFGIAEIYFQLIEQYFWPQAAPDAARNMQVWWLSLFGPTIQTVGLWMGTLIYLGDQHRSRIAWLSLLIGILTWAPQDMWISMQAEVTVNVWIDCLTLMTLIPPLFCLWKIDALNAKAKV